jgi:hypothetical protein
VTRSAAARLLPPTGHAPSCPRRTA